MVKVKLHRALYPYNVWDIAEVTERVYEYWKASGAMEELKVVKEVKENKVKEVKEVKENKAILAKKATKWL